MTHNEVIKDIRFLCKNKGLTFKKSSRTFNGKALYYFIDRQSGIVTISNMTLMSAFDNALRLQ
jgi:hypothetical protein